MDTFRLKFIHNSSSLHKGNHNCDGGLDCRYNHQDFDNFTWPFTPQLLFRLRRYIKHSRQCFIVYPNTSNFVKNTPCASYFQLSSRCLDIPMKQCLECSIYYVKVYFLVPVLTSGNFFLVKNQLEFKPFLSAFRLQP